MSRDLLDAKKSDPFKLWQFRMEKDGTWEDILADFKKIQRETGEKGFSSIMHKHAKDHGYGGAAAEREEFRKYEALENALQEGGDVRAQAVLEFEKIVSRLPDRVSVKKENNWIASHAAMRRKSLSGKTVVLTLDDIKDAPSQASVNKLSYWSNEPKEFFKTLAAAEKPAPPKASTKTKEESEAKKIDPTAKQCRDMLEAFLGDVTTED